MISGHVGWSTSVPSYNPRDVVANIRRLMAGEEQEPMLPWWRGFKGTIKKTGEHKYDVTGIASKLNDSTIEITELPIHRWTQTYKAELEAMIGEKGEGAVKVRCISFYMPFRRTAVVELHCRTIRNTTIMLTCISLSTWQRRKSKRRKRKA
jgi:hypothetical protein